jgi:hypothetical protein
MKGCGLKMFGTLVAEIVDDGDNALNPGLAFKKFFFMTALAGQHCED